MLIRILTGPLLLALSFGHIGYRRDTCFDAFFVYITQCYAHAPMTSMHAFLFVNNIVLHCQEKTDVK